MANDKILILEAPWSNAIEDTQATRDIYSSAETLCRLGPEPIRIIQRPLVSTTYLIDIRKFVSLECNRRGPNFIIFSAHGSHMLSKRNKNRRKLRAFDQVINLSKDIQDLKRQLKHTVIILDSCEIGTNIKSFRKVSGARGVIGFANDVDWVDSSVFILALILNFHEAGVFHLQKDRSSTRITTPKTEKVVEKMLNGTYRSFGKSLAVKYCFG